MNKDIDITDRVDFQMSDGESLPLTKCACGEKFPPWEFILSPHEDLPAACPNCGRKMYFRVQTHVYEIVT